MSVCVGITYVGSVCEMQSYQTIWSSWEETLHKTPENLRTPIYYLKGYSTLSLYDYTKRIMLFVLLKIFAYTVGSRIVEAIHKAVVDGVGS